MIPGSGWTSLTRPERVAFLTTNLETVLGDDGWSQTSLTYAFPQYIFSEPFYLPQGERLRYEPFSADEKAFVRETLAYLSSFLDLDFVEIGGVADLRFGTHNMTAGGYATGAPYGEVYLASDADTTAPSGYGFNTIVHETLHALGLKHPGDYDAGDAAPVGPFLPYNLDSGQVSNVTYHDFVYNGGYTQTVRPLDVFALQYLYGSSLDASDTTFRFLSDDDLNFAREGGGWKIGTSSPFLVVDTGGYDRLDFSGWTTPSLDRAVALSLNLREGGGTIDSAKPDGSIYDYFAEAYQDLDAADGRVFNIEIYDLTRIEEVEGTRYADYVVGNIDLRRFVGGGGNDVYVADNAAGAIAVGIYGGNGTDRVQYGLSRASVDVDLQSDGSVRVAKPQGGADTLRSIEEIALGDGALIFDLGSNGAAAYRLYGGAFDRTPDEGGLRFWTTEWLDLGRNLHDVAIGFIKSAEFVALYGSNLANGAFVDQLYLNVLDRPGETAGVQYWNAFLANGTGDRADVLANFTQLPEYVGTSAANIDDGFWVV